MWSSIITMSFSLFLLMDSVGNVPLFIALLKGFPPKRQRRIILREMFIALAFVLLFSWAGESFLRFMGISTHTTMIAGGIILFLIAIRMIFPSGRDHMLEQQHKEPFIVPLAVPLVAGPAVLTAVILYSHDHPFTVTFPAILIAWFVSTLILFTSSLIAHLLGPRGITACERLMGLLLTLLAVEMFLNGVKLCAIS